VITLHPLTSGCEYGAVWSVEVIVGCTEGVHEAKSTVLEERKTMSWFQSHATAMPVVAAMGRKAAFRQYVE
jgi:hypothetical protein